MATKGAFPSSESAEYVPLSGPWSCAGTGAGVGAGDAGHRIAVGDAERRVAGQGGLREQLLHAGGAAQEGVVGGDLKLDVGGHGRGG